MNQAWTLEGFIEMPLPAFGRNFMTHAPSIKGKESQPSDMTLNQQNGQLLQEFWLKGIWI